MSTLIEGAHVLTPEGLRPASVLITGPKIAAVAHTQDDIAALRPLARETVDATGHFLIPGLIDAHAHGYSPLLRGTENSLPLELWALYTVLYGRAFDAAAIRAAIMLGAAERIRAGITGVIDHTPYVALWPDALAAHEATGLRVGYAAFLHDISDYDLLDLPLPPELASLAGGPPPLDAPLYAARFAELVQAARAGSGRVTVQLGPNAPQRCTPAAWSLWRTLRDRHTVPVHIHLMETRAQAMIGKRDWEGGLLAEMSRQHLLEPGLSCAHGIWLDEPERARLAEAGATVVHNPASNLMLGSGAMNTLSYRKLGLNLALGTDSANTGGRADLFEVMRLAMTLPRITTPDPALWPRHAEVLAMATTNGAAVLGLAGHLGTISPGQLADLALIRHTHATTLAPTPSIASLVQHASPDTVDSTMVNGQWLMRHKTILAFDEAATLAAATTAMADITARTRHALPALDALVPGLMPLLASRVP